MIKASFRVEKFGKESPQVCCEGESRSFLYTFIRSLYAIMDYGADVSIQHVDGSSYSDIYPDNHLKVSSCGGSGVEVCPADTGDVFLGQDLGIVVGTGTSEVDSTDYKLQYQIDDGTDSGELEYFGTRVGKTDDLHVDAGNNEAYFEIERIFRNSSGGTVTINEIGIYSTGVASKNRVPVCIVRDKLSTGISLADGEYLKIKYRIKVAS